MQHEFLESHEQSPPFQVEQLLQAISNVMLQINHTNQAMLSFLSTNGERSHDQRDSKICPKSFSGFPSEDVLSWLDHIEMISNYHRWSNVRKGLEVHTLLENVVATGYIQQAREMTENWVILRDLLIQNFTHQILAQVALQKLEMLPQQARELVSRFGVRLNQLLIHPNPTMFEHVKLFFLWPHLRHDITRYARDQGPKIFNEAILIAQCIKVCTLSDSQLLHKVIFQHGCLVQLLSYQGRQFHRDVLHILATLN